MHSSAPQVVLVTGMSGAGKSVALKAFEDLGFEAIDNIPLSFLPYLIQPDTDHSRPLVIGIDIRNRDFHRRHFQQDIIAFRDRYPDTKILFLDCDDEMLRRRFTETRRRHPIALDRLITDGIQHEREMIGPLRQQADHVVDTSDFNVNDLRQWIRSHFAVPEEHTLSIVITSFSFRNGLPREADLVFDVRFLQNPHYIDSLRDLTGKQPEVQEYVMQDPSFPVFYQHLTGMLQTLLPRYKEEGKSYLTIAIGCTGGRHRSVCVAEKLKESLAAKGYKSIVRHRELG